MTEILVIQNAAIEGIGQLGKMLESDGYTLKTINAKQEKIPQKKFPFLIILGSPDSVNDNLSHFADELKLVKDYVSENIPVLGICLGSQLLAKAFGSKIYRGEKKEVGFYHDIIPENQNQSKIFSNFRKPFSVFHWHNETFDLPNQATRLASSINYPNQAFKIGSAVGIQFHLEIDESTINLWLNTTKEDISNTHIQNVKDEIPKYLTMIEENMMYFYKNLKKEFSL